jgi:hypothetical protein
VIDSEPPVLEQASHRATPRDHLANIQLSSTIRLARLTITKRELPAAALHRLNANGLKSTHPGATYVSMLGVALEGDPPCHCSSYTLGMGMTSTMTRMEAQL